MAEKRTARPKKNNTTARPLPPSKSRRTASPPATGFSKRVQDFLADPAAFKRSLPQWSDEVGGIVLIMVGVLTFSAVLNPNGEAALSTPVANSLRQTFGYGAFLVTLAILASGVVLLLPKVGIRLAFSWVRIIGLELCFVSLEGIFHLAAQNTEGRALARAGEGGGYVGWAIGAILSSAIGSTAAVLVLIGLLGYGLFLLLGISRHDLRRGLLAFAAYLEKRANPASPSVQTITTPAPAAPLATASSATALSHASIPSPPPTLPDGNAEPKIWQGTTPTFSTQPFRPVAPPPPSDQPFGAPMPSAEPPPVADAEPTSFPSFVPFGMASDFPMSLFNNSSSIEVVPVSDNEPIEYKTLIINGQEVQVPVNGRTYDANGEEEIRPVGYMGEILRRRLEGGKRYFTVEGFQDRYVWSDSRDMMLPPFELLQYADLRLPSEEEVNNNARIIENTMSEFDIDADVIDVKVGPTVTQYAVSPIKEVVDANGETKLIRTRVNKIASLSSDLALALSTKRLRIQAPVPGYSYVGIEVPNREPSVVSVRSVMETEAFYRKRNLPLMVPLGRDVSGDPVLADLAIMPHLLIAGTTGSGKSVCLTAMITSLVVNNTPDRVRLILLDPKMVELTRFSGLPHLLGPVETDGERIIGVLRWAAREMDRRYKLLEMENARNIEAYNSILGESRKAEHIPYIVMVVDEIGDLMMSYPDETEKTLTRLAQKARAAGMHLIVATQRPSVDVITGLIKANFPARISFAVASGVDSRVILDATGAETLVGKGDMLFLSPDAAGPTRLQGCYISDPEIYEILMYWQAWEAEQIELNGQGADNRVAPWEQSMTRLESLTRLDPMLEETLQMVVAEGRASVSQIQKRMGIDYPRAAKLMDSLVELGIIGGTMAGGSNRKVLVKSVEEARRLIHNNRRS